MAPPIRNVFRELDEVAQRLARIEGALNISPAAKPPEALPVVPPPIPVEVGNVSPLAEAGGPISPPAQVRRVQDYVENARKPLPPPKPFLPPIDFERLIGGRWYAVIGAIVCMIGIALFLKLAYEQGWLKGIPPGMKCLLGAAFGGVLIGLGEFAFRKLEAGKTLAAASLTATGLGAMFAAVYASHAVYDIVPIVPCFLLLILVSAAAMTLAIRQKVATVGLLGLLGAYVSPFLMGTDTPSRVVLPLYLLLLLASGLMLSARMGPRIKTFYSLRTMVWWGTVIAGSLWAYSMKEVAPQAVLIWLPIVWVFMHIELVYWAKGFKIDPKTEGIGFHVLGIATPWSTARAFMTSFSSTAWCVLIGTTSMYAWSLKGGPTPSPEWLVPAAATIATGALGFVMSGHLRVLKDSPQNVAEQLGASLLVQCASASVVTIILGVSGWAEPAALLVLGLGAAFAAKWLQVRSLYIYAAAALLAGSFRVLVGSSGWSVPALGTGELALSRFTVLCGGAGIAWFAVAVLMRSVTLDSWKKLYGLCVFGGAVMWTIACFECGPFMAATLMLVCAGAMSLLSTRLKSVSLRLAGLGVLAAESIRIVAADYRVVVQPNDAQAISMPSLFLGFEWWGVLPTFAAVVWWIYADHFRRLKPEGTVKSLSEFMGRVTGVVSAAIGLGMLAAAAVSKTTTGPGFAFYWAIIVLAASMVSFRMPKFQLAIAAVPIAIAAVIAWLFGWLFPDMNWDAPDARWALLVHFGVVEGIIISGALWFCGRSIWESFGRLEDAIIVKILGGVVGGVLLLGATSVDVARIVREFSEVETAQRAAVSIWWGIGGVGLIVAGFIRKVGALRHAGLALLGVAVAKALIYDLVGVPAGWRVGSFVGLGLMMLAVSVVYAKVGAKAGKEMKGQSSQPGPQPESAAEVR